MFGFRGKVWICMVLCLVIPDGRSLVFSGNWARFVAVTRRRTRYFRLEGASIRILLYYPEKP